MAYVVNGIGLCGKIYDDLNTGNLKVQYSDVQYSDPTCTVKKSHICQLSKPLHLEPM